MVGKTALVPVLGREIPVIADPYVDPEFGTGALKVTPGHDPNDYEIAKRHNLPMINIMNQDATINEEGGKYNGLDRYDARKELWADMKALGLVVAEKEHSHQVGHCSRCNTVVEPLLSEQWWVKMQPLAEPALAVVRTGEIQIVPQRFERVYNHWLENIRDWCISRQLWWGHRIPVWYGPDKTAFAARSAEEARPRRAPTTARTWRSTRTPTCSTPGLAAASGPSAPWAGPQQTKDLATYYPTTVMETGYDILFFWVARMIMMGLKFTGEIPFRYVYLHGLVRDEQGRKMSKSLGNALDPLDLIAEYGTDALRFTLLTGGTPGNDLKLAENRVEANRNFANKIWNAARFVIMKLAGQKMPALAPRWMQLTPTALSTCCRSTLTQPARPLDSEPAGRRAPRGHTPDRHLAVRRGRPPALRVPLERILRLVHRGRQGAPERGYAGRSAGHAAGACVRAGTGLRLLHPFMPFVTEAIWQSLPGIGHGAPAGAAGSALGSRPKKPPSWAWPLPSW